MTRAQFLRELAKYPGISMDEDHDYDFYLDAPDGKRFRANDGHCLAVPFANRVHQSWKGDAYQDAAERLAYGLEDCDCEDCQLRKEDREMNV